MPIVFPPVLFEVDAGGQLYDEMDVDGAVAATSFCTVAFSGLPSYASAPDSGRARGIFVIHNGQLSTASSPTPRSLRGITAGSSRPPGAGVGGHSIYHLLCVRTARAGELSLGHHSQKASRSPAPDVFDPVKMAELYEVGYRTALAGPVWFVDPPLLQENPPPP